MPSSARERWLIASRLALLCTSLAGTIVLSKQEDWEPVALLIALLTLALAGQFLSMRHATVRMSLSFLAIALAMALLGPSPAAVIGAVTILAWSAHRRTAWPLTLNNVATYLTFPLVG